MSRSPALCDARSLCAWLTEHPGEARYFQRYVFFGSSDGREFELVKALYGSVKRSWGAVDLLTSVVGGMFCLNLAVKLRPQRIRLFDRNPVQLLLFELVKRAVLLSADRRDFIRRLRARDYEASSTWERQLQDALSTKILMDEGVAPPHRLRGNSRRPLKRSWRYALRRFNRLKVTLESTPQELWFADVGNERFVDALLDEPRHWLFLSNIRTLPERLRDATLDEWVPGYELKETDTILTYSRPFRVRLQSCTYDG